MNIMSQFIGSDASTKLAKNNVLDLGFKGDNSSFKSVLQNKFNNSKTNTNQSATKSLTSQNKNDFTAMTKIHSPNVNTSLNRGELKKEPKHEVVSEEITDSLVSCIDVPEDEVCEVALLELFNFIINQLNTEIYDSEAKLEVIREEINALDLSSEFKLEVLNQISSIVEELDNSNFNVDNKIMVTEKLQTIIESISKEVKNEGNIKNLNADSRKAMKEDPLEPPINNKLIRTNQDTVSKNELNDKSKETGVKEVRFEFDIDNVLEVDDPKEIEFNLNNNLRGELSGKVSENGLPPKINQNNIMSQISSQINRISLSGQSEIKIQLMPENLGKISLKITSIDNVLSAKIVAESIQVKEIIETNLNQLRDSLSEKGISISNVEVFVGQDSDAYRHKEAMHQIFRSKKASVVQDEEVQIASGIELQSKISNPYLDENSFDMRG